MKRFINSRQYAYFSAALLCVSALLNLWLWGQAVSASAYEINGFYLGATPDDIGVVVKVDPEFEEKYFEVEVNDVQLFFIKTGRALYLYRIIKEQSLKPESVQSVLTGLKVKYGTPDKQEIKTSSVRPKFKQNYVVTTKNKVVWNISESQEFIAEIEKNRVVYELLEHNPENIEARYSPAGSEDGESGEDGWDPDY